jgi:hypothetical protein
MLVTVASFRDPWEAHLFRLRLEAEGIVAMVSHQYHVYQDWQLSQALGGVKVQVPTSAKEAAISVWDRCIAGEFEAQIIDLFGPVDIVACPKCGSRNFRRRPTWAWIIFALMFCALFRIAFPPPRSICRCVVCATRWSAQA